MSKDWKEGGFLGFHRLHVWSIFVLGSRDSATFKSCGFSGFEMLSPVEGLAIFVLGFGYFTQNSYFVWFSKFLYFCIKTRN